jgi:hypothetical protein
MPEKQAATVAYGDRRGLLFVVPPELLPAAGWQ